MIMKRKSGLVMVCCVVLFLACCMPVSAGVPGDTNGDTIVSDGELSTAILDYLDTTYADGSGGLDQADLSLAAHNTLDIPYGQIVVAVSNSKTDLLQKSYIDAKGVPAGSLIYEGLVTRATDKSHIGWLATSWEHNADGTTWTFHIPENATWQDDVPVTAQDAVFSYQYLKDNGLKNQNVLKQVTSVETPDDHTVVYHCDCCMPLFPDILSTGPGVAIFPEHIWENLDPSTESDPDYIGCGPFTYVSSISGSSYKMKAYEGYHGSLPYVGTVVRKLYSSEDSSVLALKSGDVDYLSDLSPAAARSLTSTDGIGVTTIPSGGKAYEVAFTCDVYPANITEFRQALSHAVNRDRMCEVIDGAATRATNTVFLVPALAGDQVNEATNNLYDYNLTRAKAMLADAGFTLDTSGEKNVLYGPDGKAVEITIPLGGKASVNNVDEKIVQVLREDWEKELGIKITVLNDQSDSDTYDADIEKNAVRIDGMPGFFHDDIDRLDDFQTSPRGKNYYHFDNATFNGLIDDLDNTIDPAQRKQIGDELQVVLSEQVPCIPVCSMDSFNAYRSDRFAGFDSLILEGGGDINIFSHVKPASTEVNR